MSHNSVGDFFKNIFMLQSLIAISMKGQAADNKPAEAVRKTALVDLVNLYALQKIQKTFFDD